MPLTYKDAPGGLLPPGVWPADDHCIVLHAPQTSKLNAVSMKHRIKHFLNAVLYYSRS